VHHRVWVCGHPAVVAARNAVAPRWLVEEAVRAGPRSWLFNRGVVPHPGDVWPRPPAEAQMFIYPGGNEMGDNGAGDRTLARLRLNAPPWTTTAGHTRTEFTADAARQQAAQRGEALRAGAVHLAGQMYVDGSCTTDFLRSFAGPHHPSSSAPLAGRSRRASSSPCGGLCRRRPRPRNTSDLRCRTSASAARPPLPPTALMPCATSTARSLRPCSPADGTQALSGTLGHSLAAAGLRWSR
jgi:hypothetical protein